MSLPSEEMTPGLEAADYPAYPMPLNTGDIKDDDADIMDRMLDEQPDPGVPAAIETAEPRFPRVPVATRTLTGTERFTAGGDSIKLMNRDPYRQSLKFFLNSSAAGTPAPDDKILIAQDNAAIEAGSRRGATLISLYNAQVPIDWSGHTGEVWVKIPTGFAANPIDVSWVAITV